MENKQGKEREKPGGKKLKKEAKQETENAENKKKGQKREKEEEYKAGESMWKTG